MVAITGLQSLILLAVPTLCPHVTQEDTELQ